MCLLNQQIIYIPTKPDPIIQNSYNIINIYHWISCASSPLWLPHHYFAEKKYKNVSLLQTWNKRTAMAARALCFIFWQVPSMCIRHCSRAVIRRCLGVSTVDTFLGKQCLKLLFLFISNQSIYRFNHFIPWNCVMLLMSRIFCYKTKIEIAGKKIENRSLLWPR